MPLWYSILDSISSDTDSTLHEQYTTQYLSDTGNTLHSILRFTYTLFITSLAKATSPVFVNYRGLAVEFSCVEAILNAFDCGDDFLKVTNQFLHSIQPPICMDNSIGWEWVRRYGGNEGSTVHFYSSSLIISALCFLSVLKMIK